MSISFDNPMNAEAMAKFEKMIRNGDLPEPAVMDDRRALFNDPLMLDQRKMKDLANAANQTVTVEINEEGEIKEMSDGTKYRVTPQGWKKIRA